jgi:hypothetical protein
MPSPPRGSRRARRVSMTDAFSRVTDVDSASLPNGNAAVAIVAKSEANITQTLWQRSPLTHHDMEFAFFKLNIVYNKYTTYNCLLKVALDGVVTQQTHLFPELNSIFVIARCDAELSATQRHSSTSSTIITELYTQNDSGICIFVLAYVAIQHGINHLLFTREHAWIPTLIK